MITFLPSDDVAHYKITLSIFVPEQRHGRGRSPKKTEKLIDAVENMTIYKLVCSFWGDDAYWAKIVTPKSERSRHGARNIITIDIPAPINFDMQSLIPELKAFWDKTFDQAFTTYIDCTRRYSVEELSNWY